MVECSAGCAYSGVKRWPHHVFSPYGTSVHLCNTRRRRYSDSAYSGAKRWPRHGF